jgi:hypothetical protein
MVVGAALTTVGLPTAPAHAAEPPVVQSVRSDFDGDLGTLLVTVSAPLGVESLQARLTSPATDEEVAATDEFVLRSGTTATGTWASAEPFLLEELGSYRVQVTVTDTGGNQVQRENAGWLTYLVRTSFEAVVLDRTTVTYEQREVTISGVLTGRWPGTGEVRPLPGRQVSVSSFFDGGLAVTGDDGSFSGATGITTGNEFVWAQFSSEPGFLASNTEDFPIAIDPRPTRISIWAFPRRVDRHETTTLVGRLAWQTPDGWEPIPDAQIGILHCTQSCGTVVDRPLTDARGRYRVMHEPAGTGHYQVAYEALDPVLLQPDPFVAPAVATADIAVLQPASFSDFTAVRDDDGLVMVEGHLQFEEITPAEIPVEIQYSRGGGFGWQTVTTLDAEWDGMGNLFTGELDWPASGYWRARFPGVKDHFQSAVSPKVFIH